MKEQVVYVRTTVKVRDDISATLDNGITVYFKPTTGILLTKEELVNLLVEAIWECRKVPINDFLKTKGLL